MTAKKKQPVEEPKHNQPNKMGADKKTDTSKEENVSKNQENEEAPDTESAVENNTPETTEQEVKAETDAAQAAATELQNEGPEQTNEQEQKEEAPERCREDILQDQVNEWQDKYLRLSAEFDNYRKRTLKEKSELIKSAGEDLLKDILPVMDNFERAQQSVQDAKDVKAVKEGIDLIITKFKEYLKQKGIKEINALHQDFNTDVHEALTKIPAPEKKLKGKVVDVIEKGYYLNEKVIRYAKVVVGE